MFKHTLTAEVGGTVARIAAPAGTYVKAFDDVLVLESMKMEFPIGAPAHGTVLELLVKEGDTVEEGQAIAVMESAQ